MRSDRERLLDIKEAIDAIEKYTVSGKTSFDENELIQTWVIHHFQILGEAAARLSEDFKDLHSQIEWFKIIGMRNILVHGYFGIDADVVWAAVEKDLPNFKKSIIGLIKQIS